METSYFRWYFITHSFCHHKGLFRVENIIKHEGKYDRGRLKSCILFTSDSETVEQSHRRQEV